MTDRHWEWFCEAIDAPGLLADERFEGTKSRVHYCEALDEAFTAEFEEWTASNLVVAVREAGVSAAEIEDTLSVWDHP